MRHLKLKIFSFVLLAGVASCQGCLGCSTSPLDRSDTTIPRSCSSDEALVAPTKLDILFVIDNSNSMQEEQEGVARELTAFINEVQKAGGVRQDFHVGVMTTSVYQHSRTNGIEFDHDYPTHSGHLRPVPVVMADGGFDLESGSERMLVGDDPALIAKFSRLVQQGTRGSGQETPFEAVRLGLVGELARVPIEKGGNGGFLRDGARLLIVVLTDEDDCSEMRRPSVVTVSDNAAVSDCTNGANSLATVQSYFELFKGQIKNDDGTLKDLIWAAIAPVARSNKAAMEVVEGGAVKNIDCPTSNQGGYRHRAMAEKFDATLKNLDSICRDSFRDTLINIASLAAVSQTLEVSNIASPQVVQVLITRADASTKICTVANQGISVVDPGGPGISTKLRFQGACSRRADDTAVKVKLLCAT